MSETVTEVTNTDPVRREINHQIMVQWINADLFNRCDRDVRKSIVLYDNTGVFMYACPPCFEPNEAAWGEFWRAGARTWSRGIV